MNELKILGLLGLVIVEDFGLVIGDLFEIE